MKEPLLDASLQRSNYLRIVPTATFCLFVLLFSLFIASKMRVLNPTEEMVGKQPEFLKDHEAHSFAHDDHSDYKPKWAENIADPEERSSSKFFAKRVRDEVNQMDGKYDFNGALIYGLHEDQVGFFRFLEVGEDRPIDSFTESINNLQKKLKIYEKIKQIENDALDKVKHPDSKDWWHDGPSQILYFLRCYHILNQYVRHTGVELHLFFITPAASILKDPKSGEESLRVKRTLQAAEAILGAPEDASKDPLQQSKLAMEALKKMNLPKDAVIWIISETADVGDEAYSMHRNQHLPDTDIIQPPDDIVDLIVAAMLEIPITHIEPSPKQLEQLQLN